VISCLNKHIIVSYLRLVIGGSWLLVFKFDATIFHNTVATWCCTHANLIPDWLCLIMLPCLANSTKQKNRCPLGLIVIYYNILAIITSSRLTIHFAKLFDSGHHWHYYNIIVNCFVHWKMLENFHCQYKKCRSNRAACLSTS